MLVTFHRGLFVHGSWIKGDDYRLPIDFDDDINFGGAAAVGAVLTSNQNKPGLSQQLLVDANRNVSPHHIKLDNAIHIADRCWATGFA